MTERLFPSFKSPKPTFPTMALKKALQLGFLITVFFTSFLLLFQTFWKSKKGEKSLNITTLRSTEVRIPVSIINVGKIRLNSPRNVRFKIINIGLEPLVIHDVKADCHCTVTEWEGEPIAAKDSTFIEVQYDASSLGIFQQKISIYSNVEGPPKLLLLRGEVDF